MEKLSQPCIHWFDIGALAPVLLCPIPECPSQIIFNPDKLEYNWSVAVACEASPAVYCGKQRVRDVFSLDTLPGLTSARAGRV